MNSSKNIGRYRLKDVAENVTLHMPSLMLYSVYKHGINLDPSDTNSTELPEREAENYSSRCEAIQHPAR